MDAKGQGWQCTVCTFRNHASLLNCEMCESPKSDTFVNDYDDREDDLEYERFSSYQRQDYVVSKRGGAKGKTTQPKRKGVATRNRNPTKVVQKGPTKEPEIESERKEHEIEIEEKEKEKENETENGAIESLPLEMLYLIFNQLTLVELSKAAQVCQLWRTTALDPRHKQQRQVVLWAQSSISVVKEPPKLTKKRKIESIIVKPAHKGAFVTKKKCTNIFNEKQESVSADLSFFFDLPLKSCSKNLSYILLEGCQVSTSTAHRLLTVLGKQLISFRIRNNYFSGFTITTDASTLIDDTLPTLRLDNLISLELSSDRADELPKLLHAMITPNLLHLNILHPGMGHVLPSESNSSQTGRITLSALRLQSCSFIEYPPRHSPYPDIMKYLKTVKKSLTSLELTDCSRMTSLDLSEFESLSHISLFKVKKLPNKAISDIIDVLINSEHGIETLKMTDATHLTNEHLYKIANSRGGRPIGLTCLDLSHCVGLNEKSLKQVITLSPWLRSLRLRQFDCLTSKFFGSIERHCPKLETLVSVRNPFLSGTFAFSHPKLTTLNISQSFSISNLKLNCPNLTDNASHKPSDNNTTTTTTTTLMDHLELDVSSCRTLEEGWLTRLHRSCTKLRKLSLQNNKQFSEEEISKYICNRPLLEEVDVKGTELDDASLHHTNLDPLVSHLQDQKRNVAILL